MASLVNAGAARRWRPYAAVAAAGVTLGALAALTDPLQRVEWSVYDLFSRRLARHADAPSNIVVVALDEPSIAEIGLPWPWPRSLHASLIDRLGDAGARTIAFDILFDTPAADPDDDRDLADAIRRAGNVVLAADRSDVGDRSYSLLQWFDPLPALAEGAAGVGVVRIPYDPDGVLRRAALTIEGRPSFALAVASRDRGVQAPPDIDTPRLFRFNGEARRGIVTVSYYQALDAARSLPPGIFRNAHVLVGRSLQAPTLESQADLYETPVALQMGGVEVHATIVDALLRGRFIADPFGRWHLLLALTVAAGAVLAIVLWPLGPVAAPTATTAAIVLPVLLGYIALGRGIRLPVVAPAVTMATVYALTGAYRYLLSVRERQLIKRAFQHYVSPAIVEQMLRDPSRLELGGEEYDVTVLFSDIEGFTTLTERLAPAQLRTQLATYFTAMLDVLLAQRGTLDKLIGDGIMVYFGCPIPDERHAAQACRGALEMQRRLTGLNADRAARQLPPLTTRIGINSGRVVAGNMGSDTVFNYTVIGDAVNIASRLEGVNKEYGTRTIIGEDTRVRLDDSFEVRELDWIRVKGRTQPVTIFELVADAPVEDPKRRVVLDRFAEGLAQYRERRWQAALAAFEEALSADPADGPSLTFASRCAFYEANPPTVWDGVHVMSPSGPP